ncbi:MAG: hypothetical protein CMN75_13380 [Spirochaeta sp.]|nr:hypothetical protein [Spirochaeta sp.]RPG05725.1 MAG: nuclear transport factor 2 family protein [Proteobacteria bacterium TMED72]
MTVEELQARESIRDTLAQYNHSGDRGRVAELAACFTRDGVLDLEKDDAARGREAIETRLARVVWKTKAQSEKPRVRHHVSSIKIELEDPEHARVRSYFVVFTDIGLDHWGSYEDRFRAVSGTWLIEHRHVRVDGVSSPQSMAAEFLKNQTTR